MGKMEQGVLPCSLLLIFRSYATVPLSHNRKVIGHSLLILRCILSPYLIFHSSIMCFMRDERFSTPGAY